MNRRIKKNQNEIYTHTLLFFILCMIVLLLVFLLIGNIGEYADYLKLEKDTYSLHLIDDFNLKNNSEKKSFGNGIKASSVSGTKAPHVSIYSTTNDYTMVTTQLFITKQPYTVVNSLSEVSRNEQLLIIQVKSITSEDLRILHDLIDHGVSVLFLGLPDLQSLQNYDLQQLLGIKSVIGNKSWAGIRTSSDLLTGTMVEMPNYTITGTEVVLESNNKIYACALPDGYQSIPNDKLPPIIWRHIEYDTNGRVYIFNGDYAKTEMGYGIVPAVISELNDNYIYPVINAYTVLVTGYPFAENESNANWTRLYSRDKMQIQQDMLATQLKKYAKVYNVRLSCFSPDYQTFMTTDDINLKFYVNEIKSSRGMLADENGGKLKVTENSDNIIFKKWDCNFEFWDKQKSSIYFPICFDSVIGDERADDYAIGGFASTLGFFSVNIDFGKYLEYEGEDDVWSVYCKEQEVMMGKRERDYPWMADVTAKEAAGRILKVLEMNTDIEYNKDNIKVNIPNFNDEAWFILRSSKNNLVIDNGTIEKIGTGCYFVTLTEDNATITWKDL